MMRLSGLRPLRLKAERWRSMAIRLTDKRAINVLNDMAAELDKQADELEAAITTDLE